MKTYLVTGGLDLWIALSYVNQDIHILNVDALTYAGNARTFRNMIRILAIPSLT